LIRIGILQLTQNLDDAVDGFKQELEKLNLAATFIYKNADGNVPLLSKLAQALLDNHVDLIFACSTPSALAAKALNGKIPVIFTPVFDPISTGLIDTMSAPGGKVTGMSGMVNAADKVSFLKQLLPTAKKVAMLVPTEDQNTHIEAANFRIAAKNNIKLQEIPINKQTEISLLSEKLTDDLDALFLPIGRILEENFSSIAYYAETAGIPIIASYAPNVSMGALGALCANHSNLGEACAKQAKAILIDGKDPKDIPVGIQAEPDILLNAFVADNLAISLPTDLLVKAKEIFN